MSRAQLRDSWKTNTPIDLARQKLGVFFTQHGMSVVQDHAGRAIEVKQGSQFITRLLGGWFVDPKNFPKRARVCLLPTEQGLTIEAVIEESIGFGFLDSHFKSRYEGYFQFWMNALKSELPPVQYTNAQSQSRIK